MHKILRPYQQETVNKLKERLKSVTHPLLVTASVGAGKSLIIASILQWLEKSNYRALCLTLNGTLIQQNAETYKSQGGKCGIYAASLNAKDTQELVIFGSPQSVCNGIRNQDEISKCRFNIIIIDECHNIHPHDTNTMYQRIINHFGYLAQSERYSYRIVGLTGTPYRGKGESIIGETQFFKEEVCNISSSWLISQGYLTKPEFGLPEARGYDFSNIRVNSMGKFSGSELQDVIDANERLTGTIMRELVEVMKNHKGAFIFASTRKHCEECAKSLPTGEWAIITGETPHEKRKEILDRANNGDCRYLISVNCLNVGVDVPIFDLCAWLRPTESLVLYTQGIGRVLRLHPSKRRAIVLDYAGNLERHGHIDDPMINEALQPRPENEKDYIIPCLSCGVYNTVHSRRCIGVSYAGRCTHFFEWKDCPNCQCKNDKTSRICRECQYELIDPNAKLSLGKDPTEIFEVIDARYWIADHNYPALNIMYKCKNGLNIYESFHVKDERTKNIFYGSYVRKMVIHASKYYPVLNSVLHLKNMLLSGDVITPNFIECKLSQGKYKIVKRIINEEVTNT
jgi:DNA repair protein RadD